jgi:hypothetical protein
MTSLIKQVGRDSSTFPSKKRSLLTWPIRLSLGHTILHLVTNMVLKFPGHMNKPFALTREIVIPYGEMLLYLSSPRLMTMPHSWTRVIAPKSKHQQGIRKSESTSYMMSNTMVDIKLD